MTVTHRVTFADTGPSPNTSTAFTPAQGDLIVVLTTASGTNPASASSSTVTASANGITFIYRDVAGFGGNAHAVTLHIANQLVGASPVSMTVTWGNAADESTGTVISVFTVSGMTNVGAAALRQTAKVENTVSTALSATFGLACLTTNPLLAMCGLQGGNTTGAAAVPPSLWTEGGDTGYSLPTTGAESCYRDSGFTGTVVTYTSNTGNDNAALFVELDASGAAPAVIPDLIMAPKAPV